MDAPKTKVYVCDLRQNRRWTFRWKDPQTGRTKSHTCPIVKDGPESKLRAEALARNFEAELNGNDPNWFVCFPEGVGCVYFLEDVGHSIIKIGFTQEGLLNRWEASRTWLVAPRVLVAIPGSRTTEQEIHAHFAAERVIREDHSEPELFFASKRLRDFILHLLLHAPKSDQGTWP